MADNYKVIKQTEVVSLNADGSTTPQVEITYETMPSGVQGTVRLDKAGLTAEKAHTAIEADATTREAIQTL